MVRKKTHLGGTSNMTVICLAICGLFFLKVIYNVSIPYTLLRRQHEKAGASMVIYWQILLLIFGVVACFVKSAPDGVTPARVALTGTIIIVSSHVHFILVMMTRGLLIRTKK